MEKSKFRSGVSVTTILLILMTVTLTVVSVLALASARQDSELTERNLAMTERYYNARSEAVKEVARMAAGGETGDVSFTVDAGDDRAIGVEAEITEDGVRIAALRLTDTMEYEDDGSGEFD